MQRIAFGLSVALLASMLSACSDTKTIKAYPVQESSSDSDTSDYDTVAPGTYYGPDSYEEPAGEETYAAAPAPTEAPASAYAAPTSGAGGVTHVVGKGDSLYSLARNYYNDPSKWKVIYQANQGVISDPNRLRVGQQLVIP